MKRRTLTGLLGVGLAAPSLVKAQSSRMRVVGYLHPFSGTYMAPFVAAFRKGLEEQGFVDGRDVRIEVRTADGFEERLLPLAREFVAQKVDVILAAGGSDPAKAAKEATSTIPIVFVSAADPIRVGLVTNLSRPGGNITGVSLIGSSLEAKRLEILARVVPGERGLGALINPNYPDAKLQANEFRTAARQVNRRIEILEASTVEDLEPAFAQAARQRLAGLAVAQDTFFNSHRSEFVRFAAQYKVPAIYSQREYADRGGLMSYGTNFADSYRQAGIYVGRILKGTKPEDLPVMQPSRFELVINLATAKALGLTIPLDILGGADEVIE
ncbi:putative ABC transport system substrate-binding protein [Enhydrobacter aerosaccus]|uniref:Putative ABC transport system substrate-binding protein n=1 Tax=Enhydrobacter aerosaccus TaxID=225324 RepID=A0A1T4TMQ8_9HYPH|nr:ABC transporter substrate-binding protein [Enhydrobacter aerosaccus]SKA41581.1 putative ABC transport system substrate-binding protein [Enhydrobacter aerosaccus]